MKILKTYFVYGSHFSVFIVGHCQNIIKVETEEMKDYIVQYGLSSERTQPLKQRTPKCKT